MKFNKYSSLENHYRGGFLNKIRDSGQSTGKWVATEKVHGANYSFWYDGIEFKRAKRSGFIGEGEVFFSDDRIQKYRDGVEETYLRMLMAGEILKGQTLVIYGEIFGGSFFGESVNGAKKIQKEVNYCPDVEFMAFDIAVVSGEEKRLLSWTAFNNLISNKILTAPVYAIGDFEKLLQLDNDFDSLVPEVLGLNTPEGVKNTCEGFVLKPLDEVYYLANGARSIIKSKNALFSENSKGEKVANNPVEFSEEELVVYQGILSGLTENRLRNVLSKLGEVSQKDFGKVAGLLAKDCLDDFEKDVEDTIENLLGDSKKKVTRSVNKESSTFLRVVWVDILDGEF